MIGKLNMFDRHSWTLEEEDVMISILKGIVANGGRCDTGSFRISTYEQVALKMREKIENITITAKHVQNKMKRMKDRYSAAYDMLNTSGFGWDDTRKCVTVDSPEILEKYLKPSFTPSNVASASSAPNTEQTSKRKRNRSASTTAIDINNVFEKSMERASADIAKLTEAITGGDAMTRLVVELEGVGLDCM
ncbi:hypothetical protein Dsin_024707 [Dipteronia sinensis]|uniref:Myb/SANT-like domain-containing protein n=1 Tax=Dipteronia sinensis TaxID=43782 RepID=A0AAE0DW97_9ROSI|nr:hypothetical protein Dsin_024707 [Dipteronia sinensis]